MNRKGQTIFMTVIVGVMLFMIGMVFLNFIKPDTWVDGSDSMMNQIGCGTIDANGTITGEGAEISDGVKATCLIGELIIPYMILAIVSAAGGLIVSRFLI